jgi:lysophospholipase L1-like esterase
MRTIRRFSEISCLSACAVFLLLLPVVPVEAAAPTVAITASPVRFVLGASTQLTWSSTGAISCTASGSWIGPVGTGGSATETPTKTGNAKYSLTCLGSTGSTRSATATVSVTAPPKPTVTLDLAPASIVVGGSANVIWSSTNATGCTASGAWSGTLPVNGNQSVTPVSAGTYTYKLTCTGAGGSVSKSAGLSVSAAPKPTATLSIAPSSIALGGSATAAWSSTNATACTASGAWSGTLPVSGSQSLTPKSVGSSTYTLTCTGAGGSTSQSAILTVNSAPAPIVTLTPTALVFSPQSIGTTSLAQLATLKNAGNASLGSIVISSTGDFAQTSACGTTLGAGASCVVSVHFVPTAAGVRSGVLSVASNASGPAATVALSGTGATPGTMALISTAVPIFASSAAYPASYANDLDYNTEWRSNGVPATLALDLSQVTSPRQQVQLVWYNDDTYGYDHTLIGQPGYNNPGTFTIEGNAAAGGGAPPGTGWIVLASLAGNHLHSYSYNLPFTGYNWVRGNFTASDGSPQNTDIALNLDVYDSSNGVNDGWFFNGDSITANCMGHKDINAEDANNPGQYITVAAPSFGQQVNSLVGNNTPLQENAGIPGFASGDMIAHLGEWLQNVPSKYVTINLGTNDAAGGVSPAIFYSNMQSLVQTVLAAGKVPVVPTIPYSLDPTHLANTPALNDQIRALYVAFPSIVPGPDLWTLFLNNPQFISSDKVHPNAQGCAAYRAQWAQFAVGAIYSK